MNDKEFELLEKHYKLLQTPECQDLITLIQLKIMRLAKTEINAEQLKGMVKLLAWIFGQGEDYKQEKEKREQK